MVWLRRIGSGLLIGLVTVLLLEAALQLGAFAVRLGGRGAPVDLAMGGAKILALGDSNTYGLYYPEEKAWPARFEAHWNRQYPDSPVSVMNLGYPGTNSARVRANFQGFMDKTRPDWVFVLIGNNDFWTPLEVPEDETAVHSAPSRVDRLRIWLTQYSRVYKLVFMLERSRQHRVESMPRMVLDEELLSSVEKQRAFVEALQASSASSAETGEPAGQEAARAKIPDTNDLVIDGARFPMTINEKRPRGKIQYLQPNLTAMAAMAAKAGVRMVVLTYPSSNNFYPKPSSEIREFARTSATPLIDLQEYFKTLCHDDVACHEYFLLDAHPNAKGHDMAARYIVEQFALLTQQTHQQAVH